MDISTIFIYLSILGLFVAGLSIYVYWNYCRFVRGAFLWLCSILAISFATILFGLGSAVLPKWIIVHFGNSFLFICPALMGMSLQRLNQRGTNWFAFAFLVLGGGSFNILGNSLSVTGRIICFSLVFGVLWLDPAYKAFREGRKGGERILGYIFVFVAGGSFLRVLGTIFFEGEIETLLEGGPVQQIYVSAMGVSLLFFLSGYILMLDSRYLDRVMVSEAKLRVAIDGSPYGMVVTDPDMKVVSVNARFQKVSGYSLEDFVDGGLDQLRPSSGEIDSLSNEVKSALKESDDWRGIFRFQRKNGQEFWAKNVWSPIRMETGEVSGFFGVVADVTHERQLEELKDEIEHVMRHDLKTPLNAILHFPDIIKEEGTGLSDDQIEFLDLIRESGESMLEQINGSLDLYRLEEGTYQLTRESVDLRVILSSLCKVLEPLAGKRHVKIHTWEKSIPSGSLEFSTDVQLFKRMIGNLLKNAVEASPREGAVEVGISGEDGGFTVSIHNQGAIPAEARGRFFSKFNTVGKRNGTGLGAYASKRIAGVLQYPISFETSEERGTMLTVRIPASRLGDPA